MLGNVVKPNIRPPPPPPQARAPFSNYVYDLGSITIINENHFFNYNLFFLILLATKVDKYKSKMKLQ
jgi:hypothetical protein